MNQPWSQWPSQLWPTPWEGSWSPGAGPERVPDCPCCRCTYEWDRRLRIIWLLVSRDLRDLRDISWQMKFCKWPNSSRKYWKILLWDYLKIQSTYLISKVRLRKDVTSVMSQCSFFIAVQKSRSDQTIFPPRTVCFPKDVRCWGYTSRLHFGLFPRGAAWKEGLCTCEVIC